jgi:7,8-dihydroneopterin aldolase/epimerase/oxygenase
MIPKPVPTFGSDALERLQGMKTVLPQPTSFLGPTTIWDASQDYIRVMLRDICVEAHVGLHPWERHPERPNRLIVSVELFSHRRANADQEFINYDYIRQALKEWPNRPHVDLLETLVEEVVALCFKTAEVEACRVSVLKPDIFDNVAAVGIEMYRRRPLCE